MVRGLTPSARDPRHGRSLIAHATQTAASAPVPKVATAAKAPSGHVTPTRRLRPPGRHHPPRSTYVPSWLTVHNSNGLSRTAAASAAKRG